MIKKQILLLVVLGVVGILFYYGINSFVKGNMATVEIGGKKFSVSMADTPVERETGLSGQAMLGASKGMLFDFEKPGIYGFWMKDMNFPLDIIWISEDKKITHIEADLKPDTYPKIFRPDTPSRYVLEVNAGIAKKNNWQIGDQVKF